mgnify:CR=1 FL=1
MAYLSDRKLAFANLASRTEIAAISTVTTALAQAERYAFPLPTSVQAGGLDRRIAVDKLLATGYVFRQPDPKHF